jgi:hypothetical protein
VRHENGKKRKQNKKQKQKKNHILFTNDFMAQQNV